ncbi:MAG: DUF1615 domain-containing protein [Myxococcales bacterium]|nr:DUF1615 domain-containing protein [Myxococcales bacterium]
MIGRVALFLLSGCFGDEPPDPGMAVEQVVAYIGKESSDPAGWATDLRAALQASGIGVDEQGVCSVLAVVEQESTYEADPAVPGLGKIARREIEAGLKLLGPLSKHGVDWLLKPVAEGASESFDARLAKVRTERQLDELFRDLAEHYTGGAADIPLAGDLLMRQFDQLNPVKTAGSMQVSVSWAQEAASDAGVPRKTVRDLLYTRAGGLRWGTARLFAHEADYDRPAYRFADFNAGFYASRNAAFQEQLAAIMELELALDGDLLAYPKDGGRPKDGETMGALMAWRAMYGGDLSERQIRRDVGKEKTAAFEQTRTWEAVRATYKERTGKDPAYARLPVVSLDSPKLSRDRTTAWFAENVEHRFKACLERS